ncbi:hypothetical protein [Mesorhizobium tamadayense]|nr:hypothetical protein [Mesorhizobium tamadayense]
MIREDELITITDHELDALGGYYLTWNDNRLRDWLRKISAEERSV